LIIVLQLSLKLGVDPRKPNQQVRGMALLPHGIGKRPIVAVFARHEQADEARAAGADIVGAEDLLQQVQAGDITFTKCIATPEMMPLIGRVARILGPRGLMPNPKMGTLTENVSSAVLAAFKGQVEFKAGHLGCLNAGIGRASFSEQQLLDNALAFIKALQRAKPSGANSRYFIGAHISSTMGKGFELDTMQWPFGNA
jgi:large subunit ribosomal protein L1